MNQAAPGKSCDGCASCCKVMEIEAIAKPRHTWCPHFVKGRGCGIYETRPQACSQFVCLWLADPKMDAAWKPDRCKFFMWGSERLMIEVDPAYPEAWKREPYYSKIKLAADRRRPGAVDVVVRNGRELILVFPEADISLGPERDAPIRSGYRMGPKGLEPFAEYVGTG